MTVMMKIKMDKKYWENRYLTNETGWDVGQITTPLKNYIDQIKNKDLEILIPGAGNSYEFDYLIANGFSNVTCIDIAQKPIENLKNRNPKYIENFIQEDFFKHTKTYDLILEQTFFCALDPKKRNEYAKKMNTILKPSGKLVGLLFDFPLTEVGPPFGGSKEEYRELFSEHFTLKTLEKSYNSIKPRKDRELFFIFEKK